MAAAFGKNAVCFLGADGLGDCLIEGKRLQDELQNPEVVKEAASWR